MKKNCLFILMLKESSVDDEHLYILRLFLKKHSYIFKTFFLEYIPHIRKKPEKITGVRKSQRVGVKRSRPADNIQQQKDAPVCKERKKVVRRKQAPNQDSFQIQPGNAAVIPIALISNISSCIVNSNSLNSEEGHTVTMPQTGAEIQPATSTLFPSTLGVGATPAQPSSLQEMSLPTLAITDMHIQTMPSVVGDGPFIIAVLPSGDRQIVQAVDNSSLQGESKTSGHLNLQGESKTTGHLNQVLPHQEKTG